MAHSAQTDATRARPLFRRAPQRSEAQQTRADTCPVFLQRTYRMRLSRDRQLKHCRVALLTAGEGARDPWWWWRRWGVRAS